MSYDTTIKIKLCPLPEGYEWQITKDTATNRSFIEILDWGAIQYKTAIPKS